MTDICEGKNTPCIAKLMSIILSIKIPSIGFDSHISRHLLNNKHDGSQSAKTKVCGSWWQQRYHIQKDGILFCPGTENRPSNASCKALPRPCKAQRQIEQKGCTFEVPGMWVRNSFEYHKQTFATIIGFRWQ